MVLVVATGILTGVHTATWGAFKDSPFEGYEAKKAARTVLVACACSIGLVVAGLAALPFVVLIGLCVACERLSTEWWKAILREDDQQAYSIPMRLAVGGRTVE